MKNNMNDTNLTIRPMTIDDFEQVHSLWMEIHGFGIRSIDDSKEGVERFIRRNPTTSMVQSVMENCRCNPLRAWRKKGRTLSCLCTGKLQKTRNRAETRGEVSRGIESRKKFPKSIWSPSSRTRSATASGRARLEILRQRELLWVCIEWREYYRV